MGREHAEAIGEMRAILRERGIVGNRDWEVYKPEHQRKFGYYTLPVLWGDRLVARFDSKLDRKTDTFVIQGLWLEDETLGNDEAFAEALACGFDRFVTFLGASKMDANAIREPLLRRLACSKKLLENL
jgi:hypothetical protein